jgi:DNA polymerase
MRQEYHVLLEATIAHLEELKAGGMRHVPVRSETLAMLSSPQPVVAARVVNAEARVQQGQAGEIVNRAGKDASRPGLDEKERAMAKLRERVMVCRKCASLADARQSVVFGVGDVHSPLMFVGEAPGADEDERGEPFVGKAGQLLTRIIQTMGFDRDTVFIANILKCRPDTPGQNAGNRKPTASEMATCLPYLLEQIEIIRPGVIVALGATAVEGLLGLTTGITRLRGRWVDFRGIPVMPTYHPAYLLRNQSLAVKRQVWEDMLQVLERLGRPTSEKQRGFFLKP